MTAASGTSNVRFRAGTKAALERLTGPGLETLLGLERAYLDLADKLAICARVREARERAGLEQHEIAEMLMPPVTDRTIRNYEHDRPPFKYLRQWAEITNVSYDWLLRGEERDEGERRRALAAKKRLAAALLKERARRGGGDPRRFSQEEMAKLIDYSDRHYSRLEDPDDPSLPPWSKLQAISETLGLDASEFFAEPATSSGADVPSTEDFLHRLAEQDSRLANIEEKLQRLLRLLGDQEAAEGDPPVRVVYRPEPHGHRTGQR